MITIISLLIVLLFIKFMFKVLPAIIGFSLTVFLTIIQIIGFFILVPVIGILFVFVDFIIILFIIGMIKIIV